MAKARAHTDTKIYFQTIFYQIKYLRKYLEIVLDELRAIKIGIREILTYEIDWHFCPVS